MSRLPTGTVSFLFSDIEGSTRLLQQLGDEYARILTDHRRLLRSTFQAHRGQEVDTQGDAFFFAFPRARDAVEAALAAQRVIAHHSWPNGIVVQVRMGLHTAEPLKTEDGYVGMAVHRAARICAAAHGGQILLSPATRELVEEDLPAGTVLRDLGEHLLKDLSHPQRLFQVVAPGLPSDFPPLRTLQSVPNNLPRQLTSFIGREQEITEIKDLLTRSHLVTLTGTGGSGKTRLAMRAVADVLDHYPDGIWVTELATLSDPALVAQAVVSALGVREQPGRPLSDTLIEYLHPRTLLLVLDNAEHLLSSCATLADMLLHRCPNLKILTTSREPLKVEGEYIYPVHPFPVPPPGTMPVTTLVQSDAIRLFTDRASAAQADFRVTQNNGIAVAQICHLVDGIPLAIELAAARVSALSVEQIATRLDDQFRLLTNGRRTALPRHQTLRATMDWSYDLLSVPERVFLRRLSVFVGGFTLEAAEAVCSGDGIEPHQMVDSLTHLVDKSLVVADVRDGEPRYRMLETMRQYSREKLLEFGEAPATNRRHQDWFLSLAERAAPLLLGPDETRWLNRLEAEHDNFRSALTSSQVAGEIEEEVRLAGALGFFWYIRGHLSEGRGRLQAALVRSGSSPPSGKAKALVAAGLLAYGQGDYEAARPLFEESLRIFRELDDRWGIGLSVDGLGTVARVQGDYSAARSLHEESLTIFRELGDMWGIATSLGNLGLVAINQSDYATARSHYAESLRVFRELRHKRGIASSLDNLGGVASVLGEYMVARPLFEESLEIFRELGDKEGIGWALLDLGRAESHLRANYEAARPLLEESLKIFREVGAKRPGAMSLRALGFIALNQADYEAARSFLEESLRIFRELGDRQGIGYALGYLGLVALNQADYVAAHLLLEESLKILQELGSRGGIAWALHALGKAARLQGDNEQAAVFHRKALTLRGEVGDKKGITTCLEGLAGIACSLRRSARAVRLYGAAEALRRAIGAPLPSSEHPAHERDASTLQAELGENAFADAWAEGQAMTPEQAIEYALSDEAE